MIIDRYLFLLIILIVLPSVGYGQAKAETKLSEAIAGDTSLKITFKPRPGYPVQKNSTICVNGAVILRVDV